MTSILHLFFFRQILFSIGKDGSILQTMQFFAKDGREKRVEVFQLTRIEVQDRANRWDVHVTYVDGRQDSFRVGSPKDLGLLFLCWQQARYGA